MNLAQMKDFLAYYSQKNLTLESRLTVAVRLLRNFEIDAFQRTDVFSKSSKQYHDQNS